MGKKEGKGRKQKGEQRRVKGGQDEGKKRQMYQFHNYKQDSLEFS